MKYLFYISSTRHPHTAVIADEIFRLSKDSNNEIFLAYCCAKRGICPFNRYGDSARCYGCRSGLKKIITLLPDSVRIFPLLSSYDASQISHEFVYNNVSDLKNLCYKGVEIGYGLLSFFITVSRNSSPNITKALRAYFDPILEYESRLVDEIDALITSQCPDVIGVFGGRAFDVKAVFDMAILHHVPVRAYEIVPVDASGAVIEYFENALPQDVRENGRRILKTWDEDPRTEEEKRAIGISFFEKRRKGIRAGDRVYISEQKANAIPDDWNPAQKNIVIFNSSEDEFAALGAKFNSYSLFPSQLDGIRFIAKTLSNDLETKIWIRIHPNLKGINFDFHTLLYRLPEEFPNVKVIPAESEISTYALLDKANLVVVFGSTMGAEAVYWGKPTILLSGCHYYDLGICHTPKSKAALAALLNDADIKTGDTNLAIKYGHYIMDRARLGRLPESFYIGEKPSFGKRFFNGVYKDFHAFLLKLFLIDKLSNLIFWRKRVSTPYRVIHKK